MIETSSGKLYTGITTDVERRFQEHQSRQKGARFFYTDAAVRVVYRERCASRSEASKREHAIKKLSAKDKWELIDLIPAQRK